MDDWAGVGGWLSWSGGTLLGALLGAGPLQQFPVIEASLSFMLPAMFLTLLLAIFQPRQKPTVLTSILASGAVILLGSITLGLMAGVLGGAVSGAIFNREQGSEA